MTDGIDIPRVDNIPVVSKLAKEKKLEQQSKQYQLTAARDKVKSIMATEVEEYESHFVENPFIKMRERTLQKNLDGKTRLGAKQLIAGSKTEDQFMEEDDAEKQDIVMIKESGKFVINDLEHMLRKEQKGKLTGKRVRMEIAKDHESDNDSSVGDADSDDDSGSDDGDLK